MPQDALNELTDGRDRVTKFFDKDVVTEWNSWDGFMSKHVKPWPGSHKNVFVWWELETGHAIGWNENPSRGWSFPVIKLKK